MWSIFLICFAVQFLGFIPFYIIYKKDCKTYGKDDLAVGLGERFLAWIIGMPIWLIPFIVLLK